MTGKTHQVIGMISGLSIYLLLTPIKYGPATLGMVIVVSHLGSLLPDIDQPASTLWRSIPFGRMMGELSNPFLQHRNITHSILGWGIIGWGMAILFHHLPSYWSIDGGIVWLSGMIAYGSHLLADMFTVEGVPLLFPWKHMFGIPPKPFNGLRIETGKWFENIIIFPCANLILYILLWYAWPILHQVLFHS